MWPESAITDAIPMGDALQTNQYLRGQGYGFLDEVGRDHALLVGLYEGRHRAAPTWSRASR